MLLDVVMPGKDGLKFSEELAVDPRLKDIPIILCTVVAGSAGQMMRAFGDDQALVPRDILSKADMPVHLLDAVAAALTPHPVGR